MATLPDPVAQFKAYVAQLKEEAAAANARAVANIRDRWAQQFAANQRCVDNNVPLIYPKYDDPPLMQIVNDDGTGTTGVFPNLVPPGIPTKTPDAVNTGLVSGNAPPADTKVILFIVNSMALKVDVMATQVAQILAAVKGNG